MKIELCTGLYNVFLKDSTVMLDIMEANHKLVRHYHRYKTREKAEYYYSIWSKDSINSAILN